MNVLLVDDDRFVVAALEKKIDWSSLFITEIHTAYNIHQAQKCMETTSVDICVCDIEMPGGSGLELLDWVRKENRNTQFIFLTSYADFNYAQKALSLSSFDYQLKPINFDTLYQILQKAVAAVKSTATLAKTKEDGQKWQDNYQYIVTLFWKDLFSNSFLSQPAVLEGELRKKSLAYGAQDIFLPILISLLPTTALLEELDYSVIDFSFRNITDETLREDCILYESIIPSGQYEYIIVIPELHLEEVREPLTKSLEKLSNNLRKFLRCDISCCVSKEMPMTDLFHSAGNLRLMQENYLNIVNVPLFLEDYRPGKSTYTPPSLDILSTFLEERKPEAALQNLEQYLNRLCRNNTISKDFLLHLRLDIEQLVFSYLQKNGIEAHILFSTEENHMLVANSLKSVPFMLDYLKYIIGRAMEYNHFILEEHSVIDTVLNYIHQHYSEDITRSMLADMVYLNPDYMARLFKKQTGISVINYITAYRMERAKEFLNNSDIPIGTVASKVGYDNYSYFSKLFKDVTGCTPNEYRKQQ